MFLRHPVTRCVIDAWVLDASPVGVGLYVGYSTERYWLNKEQRLLVRPTKTDLDWQTIAICNVDKEPMGFRLGFRGQVMRVVKKKICRICKRSRLLTSFDINRSMHDGRDSKCKKCRQKYWKKYISDPEHSTNHRERNAIRAAMNRQQISEFVRQLKDGKPCKDCKKPYPYYVMHFDHLRDKEACVGFLRAIGATKERILREVEKCELVCANCHAERTHQRARK